jgi:hypothetical protein
LIGYWDPNRSQFVIDDETISFEVEEIYFLTGLSHQGRELNLRGGRWGDASLTIQEYIISYCQVGTQKVASQIPIAWIEALTLKSMAYCVIRMPGTVAQHVISHLLMYYALEFMRPTIYDWCTSLLASVCTQLTTCKTGRQKNFGYKSLICSFFFERIPTLAPRVSLSPPPPREPQMRRWTQLWYRLGGGPPRHYNEDFFDWWTHLTFCINE